MKFFKGGLADYIKTRLHFLPNWVTYPAMRLNIFKGLIYGPKYLRYGQEICKQTSEERLVEMVNYAIKHVPYYRERYGDLQIKSKAEFEEKIEIIDKNIVNANWDKFVSDDADMSKCFIGTTGGTSGKPLKLVIPRNRHIHANYFFHRTMKRFGWNYDVMALLKKERLPLNRKHVINPILRQVIFDGFRTDGEYYQHIYDTIKRMNIHYIQAYPQLGYQFLKYCHSQGLDTSIIKGIFLTSESIADNQLYLIRDCLHIPIIEVYGHSEKLCRASSRPGELLYYIDEEYGYTELIDDNSDVINEPGKLGEIVGTTFINRQFPLIRYRTGDIASYANTNNGRAFNSIEGRRDCNMIYKADGTIATISVLIIQNDFNERINGIQYIQERKGYIKALIIKDKGYTEADHDFIFSKLAYVMGGAEYVEVQYVNELIYQPNGKFLCLISKVK
jgi:phenylacetate-CoA ligase